MNRKIIFLLITIISLSAFTPSFISSFDAETYAGGGDPQTIVGYSPGDEEIFFIGQEEIAEEETNGETDDGTTNGGTITPTTKNFSVEPSQLNIRMAVNTTEKRTIQITNLEQSQIDLSISQQNLDGRVIASHESFEDIILGNVNLAIPAGETIELDLEFRALENPGIYTGSIIINGKSVSVSLDVKTKLLLFDSNIVVLNKDYRVGRGDELKTKITLLPMGDPERLDVTLNYVIRDYEGKVYLTQTESVLVEEEVSFKKNFDTGALPLGEYIVGLELVYPGGVAPSSAHFEIVQGKFLTLTYTEIIFYIIVCILIITIVIVIILIIKQLKKEKMKYF